MATPSIEPPHKSWSALTALARESRQTPDIDVRASVRRAIANRCLEVPVTGLMADLADLARSGWFRGTLAGLAAVTLAVSWDIISSSTEALMVMDLQGSFTSF